MSMRSSISNKVARQLGAMALVLCFLITCAPVGLAQSAVPATPTLMTLRQALKQKVQLKVMGDGMNTTHLSLQLSNNTGHDIRVVVPANEVLHPNLGGVQTMLITQDAVIDVPNGTTSIFTVGTFCASPKTVPPPPPVQEGLNFDAGDYSDPAVWGQLASVVAAGQELATVGAFGKSLMPSDSAMSLSIKAEEDKQIQKTVDEYLLQNPTITDRAKAEEIVRRDNGEAIHKAAERAVARAEKLKQSNQITQLAIWRLLGIKSGKPEDAVTPTSMVDDFLKQLSLQAKGNPDMANKFKLDKNGNIIASPQQRQGLEKGYTDIFALVDLTVRRSSEAGLTAVASLPKDDPCDTFCSVGERAYGQGDFMVAREMLDSAVRLAEKLGEADARLSRSLNSLGLCYLNMTLYPEAEARLERSQTLRQKVFGAESKEVAEVDNNLGVLDQLTNKLDKADPLFKSAVSIYGKINGQTSAPVSVALNNLGKNLCLQTKAQDGQDELSLALAAALKNCPTDVAGQPLPTPFVAEVETNLAGAFKDQGKLEMAKGFYEKALKIDHDALGDEHPYIATILDGLSDVNKKLGKAGEAEDLQQHANIIRDRTLESGAKGIASMPLSTADLGRLWNFVRGKKDFQFSIASVRAAAAAPVTRDASLVNRPIKDKWALVIGISKFKDSTINLQYAAKDATDFADYLVKEANFAPDHVRLLTNEKATREQILNQLGNAWLPRVANPDDLVMIFFSSHGSPDSMDVSNINYLVAYNTDKTNLYGTGIKLQAFAETIQERIKAQRIVLLMDACHSGAAVEGAKGLFFDQNLDAAPLAQGTGQLVICSSKANQSSWESTRYKNGVFTHYLLEGLRKDNNMARMADAFTLMRDGVAAEVQLDRHGVSQTPVLQNTKWVGNDLVIGSKPTSPRPGITDDDPNAAVVAGNKSVLRTPQASAAAGKGPTTGVHKPATSAAVKTAQSTAKTASPVPAKSKAQVR